MVADVSGSVDQFSFRTSELGSLGSDLAVLHYLGQASDPADHAHWLCRMDLFYHLRIERGQMSSVCVHLMGSGRLVSHLGPTVGPSAHTEPDENGIGHLHQDVVHTVHVHILHSSLFHILQNFMIH